MRKTPFGLFILSSILSEGESWSVNKNHNSSHLSRNDFLRKVVASTGAILATSTVANPVQPSYAVSTPSNKELERLQKGHARVTYLLDNWDAETEICGKNIMSDLERKQVIRTDGGGGGICEKTPLRVQDFLGYKSTEDPLFKADKLMVRAAPLVDPDNFEEYLDVVEKYREKADQGAMMAYTSSWGEANPNGGKDIIEEYLVSTKVEVEKTESLLRAVLGYLNLDVLPPSRSLK
mmetsp:Transcript_2811/g.4067  ORF Transcript_2811/g.4067 Transcript_2811/m.4067 type:complete len:235 (-) Transcript_2811:35-739(-)|eukprot:CAMPEP_0203640028 /NCGR_PEP_ID=MMETSP0088-20131115/5624_1 /ASSEMBLY_ACC=CAM_ASM_001087 /TAXON_ID=426623 /ORGANISM="Chaetoceros affinis, Strain CCMP159" /LENGTH=234 /DNA_ID=CAMNT_0050495087 /DNA_START=83 /DNA_END=787 /DNA_ORIENTATION=-